MVAGETATGDAGLYLEKAYQTSTNAEGALEKQARQVLNDVARATNAQTGKAITSPAPRHPLGVYSDGSKGVHTESYSLPADGSQALRDGEQ
ncbi:MAG: hypothetical protein HY537_15540 [Deltaproteobacteria bacterium]|nr:hypothetical protein [Deltaproteobacteria bacterium]